MIYVFQKIMNNTWGKEILFFFFNFYGDYAKNKGLCKILMQLILINISKVLEVHIRMFPFTVNQGFLFGLI